MCRDENVNIEHVEWPPPHTITNTNTTVTLGWTEVSQVSARFFFTNHYQALWQTANGKQQAQGESLLTNLSKEAEVELRAYWERTKSRVPAENDSHSFHLLQVFEVRFISLALTFLFITSYYNLKCKAYSSLNVEDEDPNLEGHVSKKLGKLHSHPYILWQYLSLSFCSYQPLY